MTLPRVRLAPADQATVTDLFQSYLSDMAVGTDWVSQPDGTYAYPTDLLRPYWDASDGHWPWSIVLDGRVVGFCLVRRDPVDPMLWDMGQFFVVRDARRRGVGRAALAAAVTRHPGDWQIRVLKSNRAAFAFWTTALEAITGAPTQVHHIDYKGHPMMGFRFKSD